MAAESKSPLRPSGAIRWLNCPMSIKLERYFQTSGESEAAAEGTCAHEEVERIIKKDILGEKLTPRKKAQKEALEKFKTPDFTRWVEAYANYVKRTYNEALANGGAMIFSELTLALDDIAPGLSGTADVVIYKVATKECHIIDLKFGRGRVDAEENPQLKLYVHGAIRALQALGLPVDVWRATIYQPKLDVTPEITGDVGELEIFIRYAQEQAATALAGENVGSAGAHCRYCKARTLCRVRAASALDYFKGAPYDSMLLTPEEIEPLLDITKEVKKWAEEVEEQAKDLLAKGVPLKNWELRAAMGNRFIENPEAVENLARAHEVPIASIYDKKLKSLTELEKLFPYEEITLLTKRTPSAPRMVKINKNMKQHVVRADNAEMRDFLREINERK